MFTNLTIKARLIFLLSFMSMMLVIGGFMGLGGMAKTEEGLKSVYEDRTIPLGQVGQIQALLLQNRLAIAVALVTPTPEVIADSATKIENNIAEITRIWDAYSAITHSPEEKVLADKFAADRKKFVVEGLKPTLAALRANDIETAKQLVVDKVRPLYQPVAEGIDALDDHQLAMAKQEFERSHSR